MNIALLIIDPQVDFCDPERGALSVMGAEKDMVRLAALVYSTSKQADSEYLIDFRFMRQRADINITTST